MGVKHLIDQHSEDKNASIRTMMDVLAHFPSLATLEHNVSMNDEISKEELLHHMKSMSPNKIPRLDDWPIEFYTCMFDIIGPGLLYVMEESQ